MIARMIRQRTLLTQLLDVSHGMHSCVIVVQGKGIILTSDIGNVRHPFKCRDRTSLLAAFAELQVREVPLASHSRS